MKRILTTLSQKWPEYLLEILVITVGILGAFALNNWNDHRKDNQERKLILDGLKIEFEQNKINLIPKKEYNKRVISACYQLIDLNRKDKLFENLQLTDSLLYITNIFGSFDAQTGATEELITAGKLSLIEDEELKKMLTGWSSILINSQEDYVIRLNHWSTTLSPFLAKYFNLANTDGFINFDVWSESYEVGSKGRSTIAPNTNFDPLEFENMIWLNKLNNDFVVINEIELERYIDRVLLLINQNLETLE